MMHIHTAHPAQGYPLGAGLALLREVLSLALASSLLAGEVEQKLYLADHSCCTSGLVCVFILEGIYRCTT